MTDPRIPHDIDELERNAAAALDAIRTAARLMRAIAPIAAELRELQDAMRDLQAVIEPQSHPLLASAQTAPMPPPTAPSPATLPAPEPARSRTPPPSMGESDPHGQEPEQSPSNPWARPEDAIELRSAVLPFPLARGEEEPAARMPSHQQRSRTITVTVSRAEGPLDLVRVHGALDAVDGISGLALASYTRGRAVILLESERAPEELRLEDALRVAFPEGVSGRWLGPNEYLATIGLAEAAGGS